MIGVTGEVPIPLTYGLIRSLYPPYELRLQGREGACRRTPLRLDRGVKQRLATVTSLEKLHHRGSSRRKRPSLPFACWGVVQLRRRRR